MTHKQEDQHQPQRPLPREKPLHVYEEGTDEQTRQGITNPPDQSSAEADRHRHGGTPLGSDPRE